LVIRSAGTGARFAGCLAATFILAKERPMADPHDGQGPRRQDRWAQDSREPESWQEAWRRDPSQARADPRGAAFIPGFGGGYGRAFGGGGFNQGYEGSWGRGYGVNVRPEENLAFADELAEGPYVGRGPQGWRRSDARLLEEVSERLSEDRLLDARHIEVEVADGVVTLRGAVHGPADVTLAEMLARRTPGVQEVRNELTVQPGRRDEQGSG
jgi:hypothetical protein